MLNAIFGGFFGSENSGENERWRRGHVRRIGITRGRPDLDPKPVDTPTSLKMPPSLNTPVPVLMHPSYFVKTHILHRVFTQVVLQYKVNDKYENGTS